jgi:hypothetical protein
MAAVVPACKRTIYGAQDAEGLILVAAMNKSDHSVNPYNWVSYLVGPDMAAWRLERFE